MGRSDYHWKHEPCLYGWKKGTHHWYSDRSQTTVIDYQRPTTNKHHPTMKPIGLMMYLIKNSSPAENGCVIDTFSGSGSTLLACEFTKRKCFAMELSPHFCDVIIHRWEQATGKEAIKL